jgi:zona occludens toxin
LRARTRKFPWYVWALPLALLVVFIALRQVKMLWGSDVVPADAKAQAAKASSDGGAVDLHKRPDDLIAFLKPRIEGQPWTARAYDQRPIVSDPEVYCVAVDDGRCSCITEQGTRYAMDVKICRSVAADGAYNPTRRAVQQRGQSQDKQDQPDKVQRRDIPQRSQQSDGVAGVGSGVHEGGVGVQTGDPPTYGPRDLSLLPGGGR